jgi:hypothetical protein
MNQIFFINYYIDIFKIIYMALKKLYFIIFHYYMFLFYLIIFFFFLNNIYSTPFFHKKILGGDIYLF